jgi:hypothetical protein
MNQSICYLQHLESHQPRHTLLNVILQIAIQIFSFIIILLLYQLNQVQYSNYSHIF